MRIDRRLKLLVAVIALASVVACAPRVLRPTGPTAQLNDRLQSDDDDSEARAFAVMAIDGVSIPNALNSAHRVGSGFGQGMLPLIVARFVEARPARYRLKGAYLVRAPIDAFIRDVRGRNQMVEGELAFTAEAGKVYRLSGVLSPDRCAIWIEDFDTGQQVSESIGSCR